MFIPPQTNMLRLPLDVAYGMTMVGDGAGNNTAREYTMNDPFAIVENPCSFAAPNQCSACTSNRCFCGHCSNYKSAYPNRIKIAKNIEYGDFKVMNDRNQPNYWTVGNLCSDCPNSFINMKFLREDLNLC
jgi:hypothetical protein